MKMELCRFFVVVESKQEHSEINPGEDSISENSEHIQKWAIFHREKNWNENPIVTNFKRQKCYFY